MKRILALLPLLAACHSAPAPVPDAGPAPTVVRASAAVVPVARTLDEYAQGSPLPANVRVVHDFEMPLHVRKRIAADDAPLAGVPAPTAPHRTLIGAGTSYSLGPAFAFKPDAGAGQGVGPVQFAAWASDAGVPNMYAPYSTVPGVRIVYVDDSSGAAHVPGATVPVVYNVDNTQFFGFNNSPSLPTLIFDDKAELSFSEITATSSLILKSNSNSNVFTLTAPNFATIVMSDGASLQSATSTPFVNSSSDFGLLVETASGASIGDGTHCAITTAGGSHTVVNIGAGAGHGATLSANALCGAGTVVLGVSGAANFSLTQPGLGTLTLVLNEKCSQISGCGGGIDASVPQGPDLFYDASTNAVVHLSGALGQPAMFTDPPAFYINPDSGVSGLVAMGQPVPSPGNGDAGGNALAIIAQAGQNPLDGGPPNSGGDLKLFSGQDNNTNAGAGQAYSGQVRLFCGSTDVVDVQMNSDATDGTQYGSITTKTSVLRFSPGAGAPNVVGVLQQSRSGAGTNAGNEMFVIAQNGQQQSTNAGNNGGDLVLAAGAAGAGIDGGVGSGAPGRVFLASGNTTGLIIADGGRPFMPNMLGLGGSGFACNHTNLSTGEVSAINGDCLTSGGSARTASKTTDSTTTSATLVDMPDMSVTFTATKPSVWVSYDAQVALLTSSGIINIRIVSSAGSSSNGGVSAFALVAGNNGNMPGQTVITGLTVGSLVTVKLQWDTSGGTLRCAPSNGVDNATIIALDL